MLCHKNGLSSAIWKPWLHLTPGVKFIPMPPHPLPWEIVLRGISNHNKNKDGWGWGKIIPGWWQMIRKVCVCCLWSPGSHRPLYKTGPLRGIWISAPCLRANKWYVFAELCKRFLMVLQVPTKVYSCGAPLPPRQMWLWSSEFPFGSSQNVCLGHYRCPEISQYNSMSHPCCELSKQLRKMAWAAGETFLPASALK